MVGQIPAQENLSAENDCLPNKDRGLGVAIACWAILGYGILLAVAVVFILSLLAVSFIR
jgi:hypothetical protein